MQLNPIFISNVQEVYGEAGLRWLRELPATLHALASAWHFDFLRPMADLSYNFVGLVQMKNSGRRAVLKLGPDEGNARIEMKWLRSLKSGVPEIYQADETRKALLMECLEPGLPLKTMVRAGQDDAATRIVCQLIRDLQVAQHAETRFQPLTELVKALSILEGRLEQRLLSQAKAWFQELTASDGSEVVLHGDLHHDNILSSGSSWKVIDPHGYVGDPAAEVGVMIRNPLDCFPKERSLEKTIARRLQILADELPFDRQRIKAWCFCMTVLSMAWTLESHARLPELELQVTYAVDQAKI